MAKTSLGVTHLVIPDPHAHPDYDNNRADWLGKFILDIKPDVVINLGDMWDFPSLSNFDKGKASFHGRTFKADLEAGLEFDDRLWHPFRKAKKKRPFSVFFEGNHEHRMKKALDLNPSELEGLISFNDLNLNKNYNEVVQYDGQTPGIAEIDGVYYAHYFTSGVMGRPIGGEHPAYSLITKQFTSCTCGHIHVGDWATRTNPHGRRIMGLVAGVYQDYNSPWAGEINKLWHRGVWVKRNVYEGNYEPQFVSIETLKKEYSNK